MRLTATVPKSSAGGIIDSAGGSPAEPARYTVTVPPVLPTTSDPVKLPTAVGANVSATVTCAPGASVRADRGQRCRPRTARWAAV